MRRLCITFISLAAVGVLVAGGGLERSSAADDPPVVRDIAFPVREDVYYVDTFGACRDGCTRRHEGQDLIGHRLNHLLAATDATVTFVRDDASGTAGNWIKLVDDQGWQYNYMHVNNDTPGTDDGANPRRWRFAAGIEVGARVTKGQFIAYMGDSGNAEGSVPHLHFEIRTPNGTAVNAFASLQQAEGKPVPNRCGTPSAPTPTPVAGSISGYLAVDADGTVSARGGAQHAGDLDDAASAAVGIAATPSGAGYWIATSDGRVAKFGDAAVEGDARAMRLSVTVVAIAALPNGTGYWLATADGGVLPFGAAKHYGDAANRPLSSPVVDIAATKTGRGYWLVSRDGTVRAYGDAVHRGDASRAALVSPITRIVRTPSGAGYWLMSQRGGLIGYGDAGEHGTIPTLGLCKAKPAAALLPATDGGGYAIVQTDGTAREFGSADAPGDVESDGTIVDAVAAG
jgi:hypothetical protein